MGTLDLECECGNVKPCGRVACESCLALDGRSLQQTRVIDAMRLGGGARLDIYEIASNAGISTRNTHEALKKLERAGRVRVDHRPSAPDDVDGDRTLYSLTEGRPVTRKRQTEIPGTERPAIPDLDEAIAEHLYNTESERQAKNEVAKSKERLRRLMADYARSGDLEGDGETSFVYPYFDGERQYQATFERRENLSLKQRKVEDVVDDEDVEVEATA